MYRIGGLMRYMRIRGHVTCGCVLPVVATQRALPYGAAASRRSSTPRHLPFGKRNFTSEGSKPVHNSSTNEAQGHNGWLSTPRVVLASAVLGAAGVAWISGRGGTEDTTSSPPPLSAEASVAAFPAEPLERRVLSSSIDDDVENASSELPHTSTEKKSQVSVAGGIDETPAEEGEPIVVSTESDTNQEEKEGAKSSIAAEETPLLQGQPDSSKGETDAKGADVNDQEESIVDSSSGEGGEGDGGGSVEGSVKVDEGSSTKGGVEVDEGSSTKGRAKVDDGSISEQSEGSKLSDGSDQSRGDDITARTEEEKLRESSGASEGKQVEESSGSAQSEEEEEECGFCVFLKAGPCGSEFEEWQKCVDDTQKQGKDIVMECLEKTRILKECMESHAEYYGEILALEKTDEPQDKDTSRQSDQSEQEGGGRRSEEKAPTSVAGPGGKAVNEGGDETSRKENKGGDAEREDKGGVGEEAGIEEGQSGGRATDKEPEEPKKLPEEVVASNVDGESSGNGDGGDDVETGAGAMSRVHCVGDKCEFVRRRVLGKKSVVDADGVVASSSADERMEKVPVEQVSKD